MTRESTQSGTIITFYSFKGGTGRSMAAANIACLIGSDFKNSSSKAVLLIDWDLDAPGLHRYFKNSKEAQNNEQPGLIDYFCELRSHLEADKGMPDLNDFIISDVVPQVDLIKAGRFDDDYGRKVTTFNWAEFYESHEDSITLFRETISSRYSYCLIDARTGVSDISGICTMLLPEKLAAVFTPNLQSMSGLIDVIRRSVNYRKESNDFRPLSVFPIPGRIELAEQMLRNEWRVVYELAFEQLFQEIYDMEKCDLAEYFDAVQIPHVSYYAYGENIAVLEPQSDSLSLKRNYEDLYERLIGRDFPCESEALYDLDLSTEHGPLVWEKKLTATDAQRQIGNPTGDIRLTKAGWKIEGKLIDNTKYFRYDLFGGFEWTRKDEKVEEGLVPFDVKILGESYGIMTLFVSHKPTGEAHQHNYTTGIQWGPLSPVTRRINLTGKLLRLYAPPAGQDEPYFIEIL